MRSFVPASPRALDERSAGLERRGGLVAFGEDGCGHIYVVSASGVDRIVDGLTGPCVERPTPPPLPPAAAPPAPPRPLLADLSSPRVRIGLARRGRVGLRATPRITLTANESCRVTVTARVPRVRFKRVRTPLRAGRRTIVRLRSNRRGARADPQGAAPPPAADADRVRDGDGRGREHRPRAAPHEGQARLAAVVVLRAIALLGVLA